MLDLRRRPGMAGTATLPLMIDLQRFGDVERIRLVSWGSRLAGMDVSAYLVRGVLVDTGFPRARRAVARLLAERQIAGAMLTHYHEDHAGNVDLLAARGIPLVMHPTTLARLREPEPIRAYRRVVWGTPRPLTSALSAFGDLPSLHFVHTPGHSEDHQIVWDAERATVFSGDLWLGVRARVMHEDENPFRILQSLRVVHALKPQRMFDAHRGLVQEPIHAIEAKIGFLEDTIASVEAKIEAGWTDRAIVRGLFGGDETVAIVSRGEYSRENFVRAVRRR
jgi:glyoxylase-like metal-dependent hydrolase (beta-lactamase superfamily II)